MPTLATGRMKVGLGRLRPSEGRGVAPRARDSKIAGETDERPVPAPDHIITAGLPRKRRNGFPVCAHAVQVELAVERVKVVILADLALHARRGGVEVQILVGVAPGVEGNIAD